MENDNIYLPKEFEASMRSILADEFEDFKKSYEKEPVKGLRFNPLKASREDFIGNVPFTLSEVSWAAEGFYYEPSEHPGKHPLHEAGAYYIQEPSAMSAVVVSDPLPGDRVLDMCAAPGGKSTQIAGRLMGEGLLVSNEIIKDRARILSSNIERMGVSNALVLNETPESLASHFPSFFDKVLVDAPCSGEGMFKKEENALSEWSPENVEMCHSRQLMILEEAAKTLKPGGVLTYSTCTFNQLENEGTVSDFLAAHPVFSLEKTERFWPHKAKGEGHFVARLVKEGTLTGSVFEPSGKKQKNNLSEQLCDFLTGEIGMNPEAVKKLVSGRIPITFGENIYLLPCGIESLAGLKVERAGLQVAVSKKNRFEPCHALALSLKPSDVSRSFSLSDEEAVKYISGETIPCDSSLKGWILMETRGFSIGFGKASGGIIKNHYPKGLRK